MQGRLRSGWVYCVKMVLGNRRMMVEAERQRVKDKDEWNALMHL